MKTLKRYNTILLLIFFSVNLLFNFTVSAQQKNPFHLNKVIQLFEEGKPAFGLFSLDRSPRNAIVISESDLDYVFIDMEHAPWDINSLQLFLYSMINKREILAKGNPQPNVVPIVRIPANGAEKKEYMIKQVLDRGAYGIISPHIDTPEQARELVQACRYPQENNAQDYYPEGLRGAAGTPAPRYWGITLPEYIKKADAWPLDPSGELLVIIQIESKQAVENINEIIDVPGISAAFIGPFDLSFSLGYPADTSAPPVENAMQKVLKACLAKNIPCGITAGPDDIEKRLKEGFKLIAFHGLDGGPSTLVVEGLRVAREFLKY